MAVEAAWDLRTTSSPRSLCVFRNESPFPSKSTNPFDVAISPREGASFCVVFGVEAGSLHFREYGPPEGKFVAGRSSNMPPQLPLPGKSIDWKGHLPGIVVNIVRAGSTNVFLVLVDDSHGRSSSTQQAGAYSAHLVALSPHTNSFTSLSPNYPLPRMSCATYSPECGFVYASGKTIASFFPDKEVRVFHHVTALPSPGARSGQDAILVINGGQVAIVAVGNSFYGIKAGDSQHASATKLLSFATSSQVHPVICKQVSSFSNTTTLFLASGRECAVVDLQLVGNNIKCSSPRHCVVTMASPILAAGTTWPWIAILCSDGLISIRSPQCMAIPLKTVEVGTRPNDYFVLRGMPNNDYSMVAISYSGQGKVISFQPDSRQDMADRLMKLAIDAFGTSGFPRTEVAEAVSASFTATSYVGPEPTASSRALLRQYLEAVLGLADFDDGAGGWPTTEMGNAITSRVEGHFGAFDEAGTTSSGRGTTSSSAALASSSSTSPATLVCGTSLLCLVCTHMVPPHAAVAKRAANACASKLGVVFPGGSVSMAATSVCEQVADKLLREASASFSMVNVSSSIASSHKTPISIHVELVEAAVWLLRACGKHERAIEVLYDRLQQPKKTPEGSVYNGFWSQIKYESYIATHLSELWGSGEDQGCRLVLESQSTRRLLESNPPLGLSVFTAMHPQNAAQWRSIMARDDPLAHPTFPLQVVELLKSVNPAVAYDNNMATPDSLAVESSTSEDMVEALPLETGRALAVTYLESAIGISTGRPTADDAFDALPGDETIEEREANIHDELSYLLLEGIISERGDDDNDKDTELGRIYRAKLRQLLAWPLAKVRSESLLNSLPFSFLQEKALLLGRLGRHEDALRILYKDLQSLDLALEYCDVRYEQQQAEEDRLRTRRGPVRPGSKDCAYLPLVKVALESDEDSERGTTAAIQVLALRSNAIDRAAALRLLPENVPVSAVARPFLIPALVDSESQIRRLTVTAALLRAKYVSLKQQLTDAQIKSQASLHAVPQLRSLHLGDPLHSSKPFKARPAHSASSTFPEVMIVKHFFPRHLIIQAKVTNSAVSVDGRTLGDVAFVVAESSEEAIQPSLQVPLKALPFGATGSAWCVLSAAPQRMEGMAVLTCELRYTVLAVDAATGAPLSFSGGSGRVYVEELQDLEAQAAHFS